MYITTSFPSYLAQGDIFKRFNGTALPRFSNPNQLGFMVLTYTCDLISPEDLTYIAFCPVINLKGLLKIFIKANKRKNRENLENIVSKRIFQITSNKTRHYFFLSPFPELSDIPAYADLTQIYSVEKDYLKNILENRIKSLSSPWREKLGFMAGYLYNRVAIDDVDKEAINEYVSISNKEFIDQYLEELNTE